MEKSNPRNQSFKVTLVFLLVFLLGLVLIIGIYVAYTRPTKIIPMSYHTNIINDTQQNTYFRRVLFTGLKSQLVIMSIPPGGDVGAETHKYTEQTLFFLSGTGKGELDGKQFPIVPGDVVVVVPGTEHNFWNTGTEDLKIYTVYAPPNHLPDTVEATKADADANTADEAVGETPPAK
jgi:mannose-6-phosphate isomerase-like protein (cupin superfamily)